MTLEELNSIPYLANEIARYDSQLFLLEKEKRSITIAGAFVAEYDAAVNEYRRILTEHREQRKQELSKLLKFIDDISDPFKKAVFTARFIENKSWWEVADSVAEWGSYTNKSVSEVCRTYLERSIRPN